MVNDETNISDMIDNMENPEVSKAKNIKCPIQDCNYSNRKVKSVSAHVSSSSQNEHIWSNTEFSGWREFNRVMRKRVEERIKNAKSEE
jgi:hypothetical protein